MAISQAEFEENERYWDRKDSKKDNVNHPSHYNLPGRKECIVEMEELYGKRIVFIFCLTNAYKYLYRMGNKNGVSAKEDLDKARFYFDYAKRNSSLACGSGNRLVKLYYDIEQELKKYDKG